jgi:predicted homoserine dehydrogenase-like protein
MLHRRLAELESAGRPIQVALIGAGTFGGQIVAQTCRMQGMRIAVVVELSADRAAAAFAAGGRDPATIVRAHSAADIESAIERDRPAVTGSLEAALASRVDVVVEATGSPEHAARHALAVIAARKHLVMVTVEADVIVGPLLARRAAEAGVYYSLAYGDEPALAVELCDWARTLGFRVIASGKGTRFIPEFRKATPDDVPRLYGFSGKDYNAQMFCSFLDGTKHAIEMTALANATGLSVDVRGMHFPAVDLREMPDVLCHRRHGGLLEQEGVVEAVSAMRPDGTYVERSLRGGMYAVVEAPDGQAAESLSAYGEIIGMMIGRRSRHVMIYRPQHFIGHEVPIGIARLVLLGQSAGAPLAPSCDVVAAAKRPLATGTVLDGEGGYLAYGLVARAAEAHQQNLVPLGLTHGARLVRDVPEDGLLSYDNLELPAGTCLALRREQDALFAGAAVPDRSENQGARLALDEGTRQPAGIGL